MAAALSSLAGTIDKQGSILAYLVEGNGTPVLVIGSAVYYPRTFSSRFRASCRIAYVDLRHFSLSDDSFRADAMNLDAYVNDVECIRKVIEFDRFVLVGHSHHGNVALEYAKKHPGRVSHLVLIGTPSCDVKTTLESADRYWDQHASDVRKKVLAERRQSAASKDDAASYSADAFIKQYVADGPRYWYDVDFDASFLWDGVPVNLEALRAFKTFFADYEFSWDPARLTASVLVVMGRYDYAVPHMLWEAGLTSLPNVSYRLLEKSGHTPQLEEATVFDELFIEFIRVT